MCTCKKILPEGRGIYTSTHFQETSGAPPPVLRLHINTTVSPSVTVPVVRPLTTTSSAVRVMK